MSQSTFIHFAAVLVAFCMSWHTKKAARRGDTWLRGQSFTSPAPLSPESAAHDFLLREDRARARRAKLRAELFTARKAAHS